VGRGCVAIGRPKSSSEEESPADETEEEELMVEEKIGGSGKNGSKGLIPCQNQSE
jgi:hypothetical protein